MRNFNQSGADTFLPASVQSRLRNWWENGDQKTPCILGTVTPPMEIPTDLNKFWFDRDFIIQRKMYEIENSTYYGCAVPFHYIDLGASAMAGVLGCPMQILDSETMWAHPKFDSLDDIFSVQWNQNNPFFSHIRDLTKQSVDLSGSHHHVALFALDGMTDLMAALYGLENFLIDCVARPEQVEKTIHHLKDIWLEVFDDTSRLIARSGNPGGIGWPGIWAPGTTYPLQEDIAYNISSEMFKRFCLPVLREQVSVMDFPFFHLDGVGMISHLDTLLDIAELKAIQWQPGAGRERLSQWYELLKKILNAGKSFQVYAKCDEVDDLIKNVGIRGVLIVITDPTHEKLQSLLEKYPQDSE